MAVNQRVNWLRNLRRTRFDLGLLIEPRTSSFGGVPIFQTASIGGLGSEKGCGYSIDSKRGWGQWGVFEVSYSDAGRVTLD